MSAPAEESSRTPEQVSGARISERPAEAAAGVIHVALGDVIALLDPPADSGNCVLIAWSTGGPVGVDVEAVKPGRRTLLMEMAQSAFSPAAFAVLRSIKSEDTAATFYRIWVRKEAVLKAEGDGLGGPMQSFSVVGLTSKGIQWSEEITLPSHDRIWRICDLKPAPAHAACIAVPL